MNIFINTYGCSLKMMDGMLSIKKEGKIQKVPIGKINQLFISKSIFLSSDVIYACIDNAVDLIITERDGRPVGRLWNNKFGSISSLRKKQLQFSRSDAVTPWVIRQIGKKTAHHIELLQCLLSLREPQPQLIARYVEDMQKTLHKLERYRGQSIADAGPGLRAIEGQLARMYFRCINAHLPDIYRFDKRSKHPALDMTNAMLNYVYGILYSHIESALIKAGLDPYIGIFHRDDYNRPVLSYDVIEVFRPWADWVVWHLCFNEVMDETMFLIDNGSYWLHGDSKRILIQHFTDFFDEMVDFEGDSYKRFTHIDRLAVKLASEIEKYNHE